jgi:hypothetical protein
MMRGQHYSAMSFEPDRVTDVTPAAVSGTPVSGTPYETNFVAMLERAAGPAAAPGEHDLRQLVCLEEG